MVEVIWRPDSDSFGQGVIEFQGKGTASGLDPDRLQRQEPVAHHLFGGMGEIQAFAGSGIGLAPAGHR